MNASVHCITIAWPESLARRALPNTSDLFQTPHRYSACDDPLTSLERLLTWGHLCPTAPDTLTCYPYYDRDPFVIDQCPDLLFAGNQREFQTKILHGEQDWAVVKLVCPKHAVLSVSKICS